MPLKLQSISEMKALVNNAHSYLTNAVKVLSEIDLYSRNAIKAMDRSDKISHRVNQGLVETMGLVETGIRALRDIDYTYKEKVTASMGEGLSTAVTTQTTDDRITDNGSANKYAVFEVNDRVYLSNGKPNNNTAQYTGLTTIEVVNNNGDYIEVSTNLEAVSDDTTLTVELTRRDHECRFLNIQTELATVTTNNVGAGDATTATINGRIIGVIVVNSNATSPLVSVWLDNNNVMENDHFVKLESAPQGITTRFLQPHVHCDMAVSCSVVSDGGNTLEYTFLVIYEAV
jgi:hypothetical protein